MSKIINQSFDDDEDDTLKNKTPLEKTKEEKISTDQLVNYATKISTDYRNLYNQYLTPITEDSWPKKEEIITMYKELKDNIDNLAETIKNIMDFHDKDYSSTFSLFMDKVRKDLKYRVELIKKIELQKEKFNDVNKIKAERDLFREEAVFLRDICNNLKTKVDELTKKMKVLTDQLNLLNGRFRESEISNRQIYSEFKKSLEDQDQILKDLNETKEILAKTQEEKENISHRNITDDDLKDKLKSTINHLREELKREKKKFQLREAEIHKQTIEESKLKQIFSECIEETRKRIYKRKAMEKLKLNNKFLKLNKQNAKKIIGNIKINYDQFLSSDKNQIIEDFIFNEEVINMIREALVSRTIENKEKNEANKKILNKINLPEIETGVGVGEDGKERISSLGGNTFYNKEEGKEFRFKNFPSYLLTDESKGGESYGKTMSRFNTISNYSTKSNEEGKLKLKAKKK